MSVDYIAYAQSYVDDEPIFMGPYVPKKDTNEFIMAPVLETCSWFGNALEWMRDNCPHTRGLPKKPCAEIKEKFAFDSSDVSIWGNEEDYYQQTMYVFKFADIAKLIKRDKPYKYQGYILRSTYAEWETGEIDEIDYWLTYDEYKALDDEEKKYYIFFEWNEYGDAYSGVSRLVSNMNALIDVWDNAYESDFPWKERLQIMDNAEIVIYVSY